MSKRKRRAGERNWAEPAAEASLTKTPKNRKVQKSRTQFFDLRVQCLDEAPYQFIVTDVIHDHEWLVQEGADGQLTIDERPDSTRVKDRTVLKAIFQGWPQLKE